MIAWHEPNFGKATIMAKRIFAALVWSTWTCDARTCKAQVWSGRTSPRRICEERIFEMRICTAPISPERDSMERTSPVLASTTPTF